MQNFGWLEVFGKRAERSKIQRGKVYFGTEDYMQVPLIGRSNLVLRVGDINPAGSAVKRYI